MEISEEALGLILASIREQQATIERLTGELRGEIANANTVVVAAKSAADATIGAANAANQAAQALQIAAEQAGENVAKAAAKGAGGAVEPAVTQAFKNASAAAAIALERSAQPTLMKFASIADTASAAEAQLKSAGKWFAWKAFGFAAAGVAVLWLLGWGGVGWERAEYTRLKEANAALTADIAEATINLAELNAKGGKIRVYPGECGGRLCIDASPNQGVGQEKWRAPWFIKGRDGGFVIPKGY